MARIEEIGAHRRQRQPSRLAQQLAEAFAPCSVWSEVRLQRRPGGRAVRVVVGEPGATVAGAPYNWAAGS